MTMMMIKSKGKEMSEDGKGFQEHYAASHVLYPFFAVINVFQESVFDWMAFEFQACVWWEECIAVISGNKIYHS